VPRYRRRLGISVRGRIPSIFLGHCSGFFDGTHYIVVDRDIDTCLNSHK